MNRLLTWIFSKDKSPKKFKIERVIDSVHVEIEPSWHYEGSDGRIVRISGLIPHENENHLEDLNNKLVGLTVDIFLRNSQKDGILKAVLQNSGKSISTLFPQNSYRTLDEKNLSDPDFDGPLQKAYTVRSVSWSNPLSNSIYLEHSDKIKVEISKPFWGNVKYDTNIYPSEIKTKNQIFRVLYSSTQKNFSELNTIWQQFINAPGEREGPLYVVGDAGLGKSWWLSNCLSELDQDKFDSILIDMRQCRKGDGLEDDIVKIINDHLSKFVAKIDWTESYLKTHLGPEYDRQAEDFYENSNKIALDLHLYPMKVMDARISYYRNTSKNLS